ncbi:hypothetical protein BDQ17DRAFT_1496350, partial [Cyathus striatus]
MINSLYASKEIVVDIWKRLPMLLEEAGFINIVIEERRPPTGKWAGQQGEGVRDNYVSLFRALKTPILDAGGFGMVDSEEEFDLLLANFCDELDETPDSFIRWFVIYAQ